jgi:ZIP family zinc transporter
MTVWSALGWGAVAASSLVLGAVLGIARRWPNRLVGSVLAFGAGALISAVSYDLAEEGLHLGSPWSVALGLALGALAYFVGDQLLDRGEAPSSGDSSSGTALALGAFLDGIPEQAVLGIGLASGPGVSVGLLAAIFVSNLPESIGSATEMLAGGRSRRSVVVVWLVIAAVCAAATVAGYAVADGASGDLRAAIDGFAAGALLVMLIDAMIPEAARKAGKIAGLVTVLGFALAMGLSKAT